MTKKLLVILLSLFFLAACGKKESTAPTGFKGPKAPPDITKIMPAYGPNDPPPTE